MMRTKRRREDGVRRREAGLGERSDEEEEEGE